MTKGREHLEEAKLSIHRVITAQGPVQHVYFAQSGLVLSFQRVQPFGGICSITTYHAPHGATIHLPQTALLKAAVSSFIITASTNASIARNVFFPQGQ